MSKIKVTDIDITIIKEGGHDYISLTDMMKAKDGDFFITDWLRNRNTLDFLAVWEQMHNSDFNYGEFAIIREQSGVNFFKISVKEWNERTNAKGVIAKTGRYGGTYAHQDIAFEFGTWISPIFKLYLIKEFQRLKEQEAKLINNEWDYRRFLSKVNYRIHTDAIKDNIIPQYTSINKEEEGYIYANEAEMLNVAVFGITSKKWKQENPDKVLKGLNIRDIANIPQLTVLANIESYNAILLKEGLPSKERLNKLKNEALSQLKSLSEYNYPYSIESPQMIKFEQTNSFDSKLRGLLAVPPPKKDKN
ncbi:KilA-N domain-containing protein [Ferruginibacter sp. SUN002]|uniref:KilA-N domain-containing protein n=1 Tax=Ferruginibacter sp. SUN002 TaxID=2937789 RepID=UPI003D35B640